ncbi:MAG: hypothetical protein J5574_01850 [Lachnospiraceae bacterium]|nr:hypothetical protein [Lachnospiraceae bacterium]
MSGLFTLVVTAVALYYLFRKIKENQSGGSKQGTSSGVHKAVPAQKRRVQGFTNYRPHKDITSVSRDMGDSRNSSVLRDDKANDWLARQLREEHRAFKATSEMFDLKIEHASHCDARLIEQFHRRNCDANGIDLANGKAVHR